MTITASQVVTDIEALLPVLASIASAVNPAVGASIAAAEAVIPAVEKFIALGQDILAAKAGIDPALWDRIVAENVAADQSFIDSGRPAS
jgi:hypothetical protein